MMSEPFDHKKSLGQHFLNSDYVPQRMCDAAHLQAGETVVEVGPGTGALTREILARGCTVIAIETDPRAIATLEETYAEEIGQDRLRIHQHDARTLQPSEFGLTPHTYKVVANIPYYLSGSLFRSFLDCECQPTDLVFLVQKEVAERIARDNKESLLSLSVKVFGEPVYVTTVKRTHFTPPPKVDSAIIAVHDISHKKLGGVSQEQFFALLHLGLGSKRKQLLGLFSNRWSRAELEGHFDALHISHTARGEDLPLDTWVTLADALF